MKFKAMFLGSFIFLPGLSLLLISGNTSPEEKIIGTWEEVSWTYEKMDKAGDRGSTWMKAIDTEVQKEIYNHLIIHEAERWVFSNDGKLQLEGNESEPLSVAWNLKGRGNVLELKYQGKDHEEYSLQELTKDRLVLHFNSDLQVRGIVKMIFERVK